MIETPPVTIQDPAETIQDPAGIMDAPEVETGAPVVGYRQPPAHPKFAHLLSRTWREYGYLTIQLLLCSFAFAYAVLVPSLAGGLLVTVVGLLVVGWLVLGARAWAAMYRGLDHSLLDNWIEAPPRYVAPSGFWRQLGAMLGDGTGWRALLYMFVTLPLGVVAWSVSTTWLAVGIGGLTYWSWWRWLPEQVMADGTTHRGFSIVNNEWHWFADNPTRAALMALVGLAFLAMWVPITHGFASAFRMLGRGLLGPTAGSIRVAALRAERARLRAHRTAALDEATERLSRIERDLHDGTQTQLTVMALNVDRARESLAAGEDPAIATELLSAVHATAQDAMVDLREIVLGIHPPALDQGLAPAVADLAARAALPTHLDLAEDIDAPPLAPTIRSIGYFTIAELLANAAKHSGASQAEVAMSRSSGELLTIRVSDNGVGGARPVPTHDRTISGRQTGLAGIADRIAMVDGDMSIESPAGGPTLITIDLPTAVSGR